MSFALSLARPVPSLAAAFEHWLFDLLARVIAGPCAAPRKVESAQKRAASFALGLLAFMPASRIRSCCTN